MNRTSIEWTDFSWNPVTGCKHGCPYCYGERIARRFKSNFPNGYEPTFHEDRLEEPLEREKPAMIFTVNMGDLFGEWVPRKWIEKIIGVTRRAPQHTFQFLTKNPRRYKEFGFPENCWLGATVESQEQAGRIPRLALASQNNIHYLSIEPFYGPIQGLRRYLEWNAINWILVGAETGPGSDKRRPEDEWVEDIIEICDRTDTPLFLKDNLEWPEEIQEFPEPNVVEEGLMRQKEVENGA